MTNYEKIKKMTPEQLSAFLREYDTVPMKKYFDLDKWLQSEDTTYCYLGKPGTYIKNLESLAKASGLSPESIPCRIIEDTTFFGKPYKRILFDEQILNVPAAYVIEEAEVEV